MKNASTPAANEVTSVANSATDPILEHLENGSIVCQPRRALNASQSRPLTKFTAQAGACGCWPSNGLAVAFASRRFYRRSEDRGSGGSRQRRWARRLRRPRLISLEALR